MSRNIPGITIAKVMSFNDAGMPDCEQYEIAAIIDTPDEITPLGRIRFEEADDLIALYNILGTYIRINDITMHCAAKQQEGGEA